MPCCYRPWTFSALLLAGCFEETRNPVADADTGASAGLTQGQTATSGADGTVGESAAPSTGPDTAANTDDGPGTDTAEGTTTSPGLDPCDRGRAIVDITTLGTPSASTSFAGQPPLNAVDGKTSTSWFSEGSNVDGESSAFTLAFDEEHCIEEVQVFGNAEQAMVDWRTGFGFDRVFVSVADADGRFLFTEEQALPGTPDPNLTIPIPAVEGFQVVLEFYDHESAECGGFSELVVRARER